MYSGSLNNKVASSHPKGAAVATVEAVVANADICTAPAEPSQATGPGPGGTASDSRHSHGHGHHSHGHHHGGHGGHRTSDIASAGATVNCVAATSSDRPSSDHRRRMACSANHSKGSGSGLGHGLIVGQPAWLQRKIHLRPQHRGVHLVTEEILRQV